MTKMNRPQPPGLLSALLTDSAILLLLILFAGAWWTRSEHPELIGQVKQALNFSKPPASISEPRAKPADQIPPAKNSSPSQAVMGAAGNGVAANQPRPTAPIPAPSSINQRSPAQPPSTPVQPLPIQPQTSAAQTPARPLPERQVPQSQVTSPQSVQPAPPTVVVDLSGLRPYIDNPAFIGPIQGMIEASRDLGRLQRYKDIIGSLPKPDHQKRATARKLNDLALERERAGSMHEANTLYLEALQADPADVEISNNLGHSLLLVGAPDAARKVLFLSIILWPDRAAAWSDLGRVYADIQDFDRAIAC